MAALGEAQTDVAQTMMWVLGGSEDDTVTLFQESFNVPLSAVDKRTSRYLLADLSVFNTTDHICCARLTWNVVTFPTKPGRPPPPPPPVTLERDGAQIQLPSDPLTHPVFCTLHRLGDIIPPRPILVIVQFYEGPKRKVAVTLNAKSLQPAEFACTSRYTSLQIHAMDAVAYSDSESEESDDDGEEAELLRQGFLVESGSSDVEDGDDNQ